MTEPDVQFRPMRREDLTNLAQWLRDPAVSRWWPTPTPENVAAEYGPCIDGIDPTEVFVVVVDGRDAGVIQRFRFDDEPEWARTVMATGTATNGAAGIDYLLGPASARGRGVGTRMIDRFSSQTLMAWDDIDRIVVAVQQENRASWRALERAGYRRIWAGQLESDDPSDAGPAYVFVVDRP